MAPGYSKSLCTLDRWVDAVDTECYPVSPQQQSHMCSVNKPVVSCTIRRNRSPIKWSHQHSERKIEQIKQLNRRRNPAPVYEPVLSTSSRLPLEALLLLPLLSDLGELPLVVLPRPAVLGLAPGVVLHPLHLLLPRFHQLVVALADLLLLCDVGKTSFYFHTFLVRFSGTEGASEAKRPWRRFRQKKSPMSNITIQTTVSKFL